MINKLLNFPTYTEQQAYEAGKDCAVNGPNTSNCHFRYFSSPEKTKAWEKGSKDGKERGL